MHHGISKKDFEIAAFKGVTSTETETDELKKEEGLARKISNFQKKLKKEAQEKAEAKKAKEDSEIFSTKCHGGTVGDFMPAD